MGFRFKKVIKIAPGVKLNISKSGISTSLGPNGATVNIGKNGVKGTLGIPGSGLSYQKQLVNKKGEIIGKAPKYEGQQQLPSPSKIELEGKKGVFLNEYGQPYTATIQTKLRVAYAAEYREFLQSKADEGNLISNKINNINRFYEVSDYLLGNYTKKEFPLQYPNYQEILNNLKSQNTGFFSSLFGNFERDANIEYQSQLNHYNMQKQQWDDEENQTEYFAHQMRQTRQLATQGDIDSINILLEQMLLVVDAPIQFTGSFELDGINGLWLDIDLPEIEDISDEEYSVLQSGQLSIKRKTDKKRREDYSRLVSGILFILANHVFTLCPTIETIVISGYTQRMNRQLGVIQDDYIYSYIVEKSIFNQINLENANPIEAMDLLTGVRKLNAKMEWGTIQPYYNGNQ